MALSVQNKKSKKSRKHVLLFCETRRHWFPIALLFGANGSEFSLTFGRLFFNFLTFRKPMVFDFFLTFRGFSKNRVAAGHAHHKPGRRADGGREHERLEHLHVRQEDRPRLRPHGKHKTLKRKVGTCLPFSQERKTIKSDAHVKNPKRRYNPP